MFWYDGLKFKLVPPLVAAPCEDIDGPASGEKGSQDGAALSPFDDGLGKIDICEDGLLKTERDFKGIIKTSRK